MSKTRVYKYIAHSRFIQVRGSIKPCFNKSLFRLSKEKFISHASQIFEGQHLQPDDKELNKEKMEKKQLAKKPKKIGRHIQDNPKRITNGLCEKNLLLT